MGAMEKPTTIGDRIRIAREMHTPKKISVPILAQRVGLAASTLYDLERGDSQSTTKLHLIADVLEVRAKWLETGEPPMRGEPELKEEGFSSAGVGIRGNVPLISWVQAGDWNEIVDNFQPGDAEDWLACPVKHSATAYCLRVSGASMYNPHGRHSYADGDIIFVDPERPAQHGDRVIVRLEEQRKATFKQLIEEDGRTFLRALNPSWPEPIIEVNERATICGVIIGKWVPE